jgi:MoxR-like ATPase
MNAELFARLDALSKNALVAIAKQLNVSLGDYARKSKETIIGLIQANATDSQVEIALLDQPAPAPEHAPAADSSVAEAQLTAAIRAIAGGSVNEDRVRQIVDEAVAALPTKIVEKTIIIKDKVEVTLPEGEYVRPETEMVLALVSQRLNVMLVGPAGSGKSTFAEFIAKACNLPFSANSCSAGMSESALSGWLLPVSDSGKFTFVAASFVHAYENGGLHLIDEVDAADPNTLVFINQAIANGRFYLPQRHENPIAIRHPDFVCLAAANTFGNGGDRMYVGREQLDAATLDRFWMVEFGYDAAFEERLVDDKILSWGRELRKKVADLKLRRVVSSRKLIEASKLSKAGVKFDKIKELFFAPWSIDERNKVGYAA